MEKLKKSRIKYENHRFEHPISAAVQVGNKLAIAFPAREDEVSGKIIELPKIDLDGRIIPVPEDVKKLVAIPARSKKQQKYVLLAVTQSKFILFNDQGKRKATASHQNFQRKLHCVWDSSGEVLYSTSGRFTVTSWNFGFGLNSINMGVEIESSKFEVIGLSVNNYRQLAILGSG